MILLTDGKRAAAGVEGVKVQAEAQLGKGGFEGFGDRQGILVGAGQEVEIMEHGAFQIAQVIIGGAAAAQGQAKKQQAPPAQKTAVIIDQRLLTSIGQLVQPGGQMGEEVADGSEESPGQGYDLPRRRRRAVTWDRIRARDSWVI